MESKTVEKTGQATKGLSIYGYPQCPFCQRVLRAVDGMGLEIELRNTATDNAYQSELVGAMGRATVPVLRIEKADGQVRWLPESLDIIEYLEERFEE